MAVEIEAVQLDESEIEFEEQEPSVQVLSDNETLRSFSKIQDSSLKKSEFRPVEIATTRYFMQQLQHSLSFVKTEVPSDNEVDNESSSNERRKRTRRSIADVRLIYSDEERETDDSEYSPDIVSSSTDDSDISSDDWTPKAPPKKRKKIQKKKKIVPEVHSFSTSQHQSKTSEMTTENTESQQSDSTNSCFVCELCNKKFENKKGLLSHTSKMHMSDKPYACSSCDKTFASSSNLQKHVRIHTQEKPYSCTICDKRFADGSNMRKHMEIHGVPHVCNGCDKELQHSLGLQSCETLHDDNSSACRNDSTVSSHKNNENQTGEEEQLYKCEKCGSNFTVKAVFEKHLKLHEICKNYHCTICDKFFCSANDLLRHDVKFHGKVLQMHEENENNKTGVSNEQVALITAVVPEKPPQNSNLSTESNKTVKFSQSILIASQLPTELSGSEQLPISLNQLQNSESIHMPATNQNELPVLLQQYDIQPLTEIEKLHSFAGVVTQRTSCGNEKSHLSFQQSKNLELESKSLSLPLECQKTNMSDYEIALLEKQKAANTLNPYHQLLVNLLDGKENAHEKREIIQSEQKNGSVLDKRDSEMPVLGLVHTVHNVLTTNIPAQRVDLTQDNNYYSTCEIADKSEEDMNSLGIFFEN